MTLGTAPVISKEKNQQHDSFHYVEVGTSLPIPYPGIAVGHRKVFDNFAFDSSLSFNSMIIMKDVSLNTKFLGYFENSQYAGIGSCSYLGKVYDIYFVCFSPFIAYGKEYEKCFFETNFSPIRLNNYGLDFLPSLSIKYGFKY